MAQQYSTKDFFRRMPNAMLARYFHGKGLFTELDFGAMKETQPEALLTAWVALPDLQRAGLEADLRAVHELSNKKGLVAIQDAARTHLERQPEALADLMARLAALDDPASQAMTVFLEHPDLWVWAERFHHADRLAYWKKRKNLPRVDAATDAASLAELAALMKAHFMQTEGRGRNCVVEHYPRGGKDYFFAFPEDHAMRGVEWVDGAMAWRPHNPAFEVVFVYAKAEGTLDLFCRGASKAVVPLQELFAKAILKQSALPADPKDERVYDLSPLLKPNFVFRREPTAGIGAVVVRKLRLSSRVRKGDRITLEADGSADRAAIYDLLAQVGRAVNLDQYNVTQVELSAQVWAGEGKPPRTVNFLVTHPNSCSLKYDEMDLRLRAMLVASGIEPQAPMGPGPSLAAAA